MTIENALLGFAHILGAVMCAGILALVIAGIRAGGWKK